MRQCGKIFYSRTCHRWQNGAFEFHAGYLRLQIHTLSLCNIHRFSTATMAARNRLHVQLHVHAWLVRYYIWLFVINSLFLRTPWSHNTVTSSCSNTGVCVCVRARAIFRSFRCLVLCILNNASVHKTLTRDKRPQPQGIRTQNPGKRAAEDPRLRPRGRWDGHIAPPPPPIYWHFHCNTQQHGAPVPRHTILYVGYVVIRISGKLKLSPFGSI
jgi:hypothetical protein